VGYLVVGIANSAVAAYAGRWTFAIISLSVAGAAGVFLAVRRLLQREAIQQTRLQTTLREPAALALPSVLVIVLAAVLFVMDPGLNALLGLAPLLLFSWVVGAGLLVALPPAQGGSADRGASEAQEPRAMRPIIGIVMGYLIMVVPARLPGLLDGLPWDIPTEFLCAAMLLPLAFVMSRKFLGRSSVLLSLGLILAAKIAIALLLPRAGLGVLSYGGPSGFPSNTWTRTYSTLIAPDYSQIISSPYLSYRQLPIEWVNSPGFDPDAFRTDLQLVGFARLRADERLVFRAQGAKTARIRLIDAATRRSTTALVVEDPAHLTSADFEALPESSRLTIEGHLSFRSFGTVRFEPLLLSPTGAHRSALELGRIWIDASGTDYTPEQTASLRLLVNVLGLILIGIIATALIEGLLARIRFGQLSHLDVYLGASGLLALYAAGLFPKPEMNLVVAAVLVFIGGAKVIEAAIHPRRHSAHGLLLALGVPILLVFASLELGSLRSVTVFPQWQDGLEYQNHARNIFVNGDPFLLKTTPRAYKVLYPYLVGILHVLFGQSSSAQLFLNAWAAVLSFVLLADLARTATKTAVAYVLAMLFLAALCTTYTYIPYFRFGLIEPVAVLALLATCSLALQGHIAGMFAAGLLTTLLRLDYVGAVLAALTLSAEPFIGPARAAWGSLLNWLGSHWKLALAYAATVALPPLLIVLGYFLAVPDYVLNAVDTRQTSGASVLDGLLRVIAGGNLQENQTKIIDEPAFLLLLVLPLVAGFLVSAAALVYRGGILARMDLRWPLIILAFIPVYAVVHPAAYAPRFSLPLLPFDLIVLAVLFLPQHTVSHAAPNVIRQTA
jgi:hypothetical protein